MGLTKCGPDLQERMVELIAAGTPLALAEQSLGVSRRTVQAWLLRGRETDEEPYHSFARATDAARAKYATQHIQTIEVEASEGDWRAAAYLLERYYPEVFQKRRGRPPNPPSSTTNVAVVLQEAERPMLDATDTSGAEINRELASARRMHFLAERASLEVQRARDELVKRADVQSELDRVLKVVKTEILRLPSRMAPELSALTDPKRIEALLDAECRSTLMTLADSLADV